MRVIVVADDLTGANVTVSLLKRQGLPSHTRLLDGVPTGTKAVSVNDGGVHVPDLDTRDRGDIETTERITATDAQDSEANLIGLWIDSTLRGPIPAALKDGLSGREEPDQIAPAIAEARRQGQRVSGPEPADSVFHVARLGRFDAVLSLYHDQGHIAPKMIDFERTVSVTLGLPIMRMSVGHGTAFDIAGTGKATAVSLIEAMRVGARFARPGVRSDSAPVRERVAMAG